MAWLFVGLIVFWVLFVVGSIHVTRAAALARERRENGTWDPGKRGSPTSNSRREFRLEACSAEKKGFGLLLRGKIQGCMPRKNDVVYLETAEIRVPVQICSIREENMPEEGTGVPASVRLGGVPRKIRKQLNNEEKAYVLTNLRKLRTTSEETGAGQESPAQESLTELHYPIRVVSPLGEILPIVGMLLAGLFSVVGGCAGIAVYPDFVVVYAFMIGTGTVFCFGSIYFLLWQISFVLTITEEQVSVRRFFKNTVYHINNLRYHSHLSTEHSGRWIMDISNMAGGAVASIDNRYRNYDGAYEAFQRAAEKRKELRNRQAEYSYLSTGSFFLRGTVDAQEPDGSFIPEIKVHRETGERAVILYDRKENARGTDEQIDLLSVTIEYAVSLIAPLKLDKLVIFPSDDSVPDELEITPEHWAQLTAENPGKE